MMQSRPLSARLWIAKQGSAGKVFVRESKSSESALTSIEFLSIGIDFCDGEDRVEKIRWIRRHVVERAMGGCWVGSM